MMSEFTQFIGLFKMSLMWFEWLTLLTLYVCRTSSRQTKRHRHSNIKTSSYFLSASSARNLASLSWFSRASIRSSSVNDLFSSTLRALYRITTLVWQTPISQMILEGWPVRRHARNEHSRRNTQSDKFLLENAVERDFWNQCADQTHKIRIVI